jgi:hypothetical protein
LRQLDFASPPPWGGIGALRRDLVPPDNPRHLLFLQIFADLPGG